MAGRSSEKLGRPVFYDGKGTRWKFCKSIWFTGTLVTLALAIFFLSSIFSAPFLPQIRLKSIPTPISDTKPERGDETGVKQLAQQAIRERTKRELADSKKSEDSTATLFDTPVAPLQRPPLGRPLSIGFYVNWDDSSFASLKHNLDKLDWVVPEWIRLSGNDDDPLVLDIDSNALNLIQTEKPETVVLPLLQNYKDERWNSSILAKAIRTPESRQRVINSLLSVIEQNRFGGITVDLEEVPAESQANLLSFVNEMRAAFHEKGLIVAQAVPFDNPDWNYKAYAQVTDYVMLMAYDEHWSEGQPGPIASQPWFDKSLAKRAADIPADKMVLCFGNYGYNWTRGSKVAADDVTFQEAVLAARDSLDSPTQIEFDGTTRNPGFHYVEDDGKTHEVWFLDAVTAFNQLSSAKHYGFAGYALWRLGSEDPSLWNIFGIDKTLDTPDKLDNIKYAYDVDFEGTGEILQVAAEPTEGARKLIPASDGSVSRELYQTLPSGYVIRRTGDQPGKIALTFDDGPDAEWTPQILDILKEKQVPATFFVIGENGQSNPDLLKRIVDEGHEIGNHSYTHPNLGAVPNRITSLELNATQRLIESVTGRSTRLFRAPYFGDAEPRTPDEVEPTVEAQNLGYISVGLHIDPDDWLLTDANGPRSADDIVNETIEEASITTPELRGQIVLLHDGGGDRHLTAEALPRLIDELRSRGFQFTTVSDLANVSYDDAMPPVPQDDRYFARADSLVFYGLSYGGMAIKLLFLIGIGFGLFRVAVISSLALAQYVRSRKRDRKHFGEEYQPFVSIVVPAFNEEKVIGRTIESLLASDYPDFEVIVVDDGSSDDTYQTALVYAERDSRVAVHTKENGGKAEALNFGWHHAKGEVIVALDADTLFTEGTLRALARRFADEKIGAIAGNAKVGNRINVVTRWQALEYVTSQNLDRRAFSSLNCITVVPGSVGAWRRNVLESLGGFSSETLAEDQDLTIRVRKAGYKIGYEEDAIGYTEAPDTLLTLARQRFRWSFGTLQCMWKHKDAFLNPKYGALGFIAMPNVWIFQVLFPLVSPLMDILFLWSFVSALIGYFQHQREYSPTNLIAVAVYYVMFLIVDLAGAYIAFLFEKRERKRLLFGLLIQRFGYRQIMYVVMVRSVLRAIRGAMVGWGKLERKATVAAELT